MIPEKEAAGSPIKRKFTVLHPKRTHQRIPREEKGKPGQGTVSCLTDSPSPPTADAAAEHRRSTTPQCRARRTTPAQCIMPEAIAPTSKTTRPLRPTKNGREITQPCSAAASAAGACLLLLLIALHRRGDMGVWGVGWGLGLGGSGAVEQRAGAARGGRRECYCGADLERGEGNKWHGREGKGSQEGWWWRISYCAHC